MAASDLFPRPESGTLEAEIDALVGTLEHFARRVNYYAPLPSELIEQGRSAVEINAAREKMSQIVEERDRALIETRSEIRRLVHELKEGTNG